MILMFLAVDFFFYDWELLIFWVRKLAQLSEWIAFWR
ncbi:hypothetical protein RB2150_01559 [Rhodobacteraceae bacterium HTCC2150]|nr:hypothetical protein RB2150_01559 [Rhodobacteraceae bacterium HTCC2150]